MAAPNNKNNDNNQNPPPYGAGGRPAEHHRTGFGVDYTSQNPHPPFPFPPGGPSPWDWHREGGRADWAGFGPWGRWHGWGRNFNTQQHPDTAEAPPADRGEGPSAQRAADSSKEKDSPDTMMGDDTPAGDQAAQPNQTHCAPGDRQSHEGCGRRRGGGPWGRCHRGGPGFGRFRHHGHGWGPHHHHPGGPASFDFGPWAEALANHPFAQAIRNYMDQATRDGDGDDENNFTPPVDIFDDDVSRAYIIHVSLPGAKKEDIGVHYDEAKHELTVAGVVHRPGDEKFLATLVSGERRVGVFERVLKIPPVETQNKEEVDSTGISAKMVDGVLIITVPKLEPVQEWTEIRKVDIE